MGILADADGCGRAKTAAGSDMLVNFCGCYGDSVGIGLTVLDDGQWDDGNVIFVNQLFTKVTCTVG